MKLSEAIKRTQFLFDMYGDLEMEIETPDSIYSDYAIEPMFRLEKDAMPLLILITTHD